MTKRFALFDVVTIREDIAGSVVPTGARGTVVDIHELPELAYEVEVCDDNGRELWLGALWPTQLELWVD